MRRALAALLLAALLANAFLPAAEAAPFPQTRRELRELARDVLHEADEDAAHALAKAESLVRAARGLVGALAPRNGELEARASLVQPVVRGEGGTLALLWAGAASDARPWIGAYWIESSRGASSPNLFELHEEGGLFYLDASDLDLAGEVDVTFHFLGIDGAHVAHHAGRAPLLDERPEPGRADLGAAAASARAPARDLALVTPWNLLERPTDLALTLHAGEATLERVAVSPCDDDEDAVEPGCRQIYLLALDPSVTHLTLWREDAGAPPVAERVLTRAELVAGFSFGA